MTRNAEIKVSNEIETNFFESQLNKYHLKRWSGQHICEYSFEFFSFIYKVTFSLFDDQNTNEDNTYNQ